MQSWHESDTEEVEVGMNDWLVACTDCDRQQLYVLALQPTISMSRCNGIGISDAVEVIVEQWGWCRERQERTDKS